MMHLKLMDIRLSLSKGQVVDYNGSIKTTKNNTICCSDVVRKMKHTNYRLIVGQYASRQRESISYYMIRHSIFGKSVCYYVKSIPPGKEAQ